MSSHVENTFIKKVCFVNVHTSPFIYFLKCIVYFFVPTRQLTKLKVDKLHKNQTTSNKILKTNLKPEHTKPKWFQARLPEGQPSLVSSFPSTALCWGGTSVIPSVKEIRLVDAWKRAFSAVTPQLWNSLPCEVCLARSLLQFYKLVKVELFQWVFM